MSNICVGRPIIEILAKEGAWCNSEGDCVIAADDLHGNNPYTELDRLRAELVELRPYCETLNRRLMEVGDELKLLRAENAELRNVLVDAQNEICRYVSLTRIWKRISAILAKTAKEGE